MMKTTEWLDTFLPMLRCPVTRDALRPISDEEKQRAGIALDQHALINHSGTHAYPVIDGIPHLLPGSAIVV